MPFSKNHSNFCKSNVVLFTGIAQILGILAINKNYRTQDVLFYVQWLIDDASLQTKKLYDKVPFKFMVYEKVFDEQGNTTNVYMRSIISAAEINRPAFVVPKTVLQSGAP